MNKSMRVVALLAMVPLSVWADCMDWSWNVFPAPGTVVPTNARFVVQAYGSVQPVVVTLAARHPRLVTPDGEQIPLKVIETNVGEFHVTQAVLQPKGALTEGVRYTLHFDQPSWPEQFELSKDASASWTVGPADFEAPRWVTSPSAQPGRIVQYGCGPAVEARVATALSDASPVLFRARVKRPDGSVREYLLERKEGDLVIGHSMCSGAFELGEKEWTLELSAVDLAGNTSPAPGPPLKFKGVESNERATPDASVPLRGR